MIYRPLASALLGLASLTAVYAQTDTSTPPAQDFATVKARHLAHLEQELTCVQAATNFETLHACMPQPPGGHRGPPPPDKQ